MDGLKAGVVHRRPPTSGTGPSRVPEVMTFSQSIRSSAARARTRAHQRREPCVQGRRECTPAEPTRPDPGRDTGALSTPVRRSGCHTRAWTSSRFRQGFRNHRFERIAIAAERTFAIVPSTTASEWDKTVCMSQKGRLADKAMQTFSPTGTSRISSSNRVCCGAPGTPHTATIDATTKRVIGGSRVLAVTTC
jgi:hypothetical protein